ncbi:ribonuclease HI family protein [Staphylococcus coagulans]|uniref:ribonuclease HI family protein n=1 Tax=Staphylococcus coagulans TaxID=74706 RepID=UPI001BE73351|nr:ribonuclease HI family protein [Staphylococcus coagulans]MBT2813888.1 ribonuclease HI family protein [Staphylococcus coagulans]MBT2816207.1 ribonuclease HI family protein [Staphylococcus coagulans]MBT2836460.1 ribonuclease HI family protein [Staphylococcus coagulans]MBT2840988.1 ribonuclease HI family protein [Staphylococcus coagulans]MBT2848113.1 ribonuclease HI family protein [Staphylococcus coagulans]
MAKIHFDAATKGNPGLSTCGVVIVDEHERYTATKVLGMMDNHTAEWEALLFAMEQAKALNIETALIYTDSQLIEDAVNREYVKNKRFKAYLERYLNEANHFALCFVKWVPRKQNKAANQLAQDKLYQTIKQQSDSSK